MHPWVDDPVTELERIAAEREKLAEQNDAYGQMFGGTNNTGGVGNEKQ